MHTISISRLGFIGLLLMAYTIPASATDSMLPGNSAKGGQLHKAKCSGCHDTSVYTRKPRLVNTVEGLQARVMACSGQVSAGFTKEELKDVVKYLNDRYYRF